jgi:hypothetical protein
VLVICGIILGQKSNFGDIFRGNKGGKNCDHRRDLPLEGTRYYNPDPKSESESGNRNSE